MLLFFDTETTGLPLWNDKSEDPRQPRIVSIAWMLEQPSGASKTTHTLVKPEGFTIPDEVVKIHGITTEKAMAEGRPLKDVIDEFIESRNQASLIIGHNVSFDMRMIRIESKKLGYDPEDKHKDDFKGKTFCTMQKTTNICKLPGTRGYKWPTLSEATKHLFNEELQGAHGALADMQACARIYKYLNQERKAA